MSDTHTPAGVADQPLPPVDAREAMPPSREVFLYFLLLGFINVGGPVAQITMMFNHMVERRRWLSNDRFVRIMGFCHMLTENPRLFFMHFWANDDAQKLARGLRAALDKVNIKKG